VAPTSPYGGIALEAGLPPVLIAADDLRTVLTNLVGNAVKYNRDGGRVTVTGRLDGEWVRLDVADTGIGMRPENLEHVFDEFYLLDGLIPVVLQAALMVR